MSLMKTIFNACLMVVKATFNLTNEPDQNTVSSGSTREFQNYQINVSTLSEPL